MEQKEESLKDLRRPQEGTTAQRTNSYQPIRHGHLPKEKRKVLA
jgi:hypothetical protein